MSTSAAEAFALDYISRRRALTEPESLRLEAALLRIEQGDFPSIAEIQRRVCERFHLKPIDMVAARRSRDVARPRQVAMYLAKEMTPRSLVEIGRRFGGRDHTTVLHACRQVERLCAADPEFAEVVRELEEGIRG